MAFDETRRYCSAERDRFAEGVTEVVLDRGTDEFIICPAGSHDPVDAVVTIGWAQDDYRSLTREEADQLVEALCEAVDGHLVGDRTWDEVDDLIVLEDELLDEDVADDPWMALLNYFTNPTEIAEQPCAECGEPIGDEEYGEIVKFIHAPNHSEPHILKNRIVAPHVVGDLREMIDGLDDDDIIQFEIPVG